MRRRQLAFGLLGAGAVAAMAVLWPSVPREQPIALRLPNTESGTIEELELNWYRAGDALGGVRLSPATPVRVIHHTARLPNGQYQYVVSVRRKTDGRTVDSRVVRGRVNLTGDQSVIWLRQSP